MMRFRATLAAVAISVALAGCQQEAAEPAPLTADELAAQIPDLTTSLSAANSAGLRKRLNADEPITYLAPSESAWRNLPSDVRDYLWANPAALRDVLRRHIVVGSYLSTDLLDGQSLPTVSGSSLDVSVTTDGVRLGGARVVRADIKARNGVVHIIDELFLWDPHLDNIIETATNAGGFSTLVAAVEAAGLTETLSKGGPFTVFAPTDDAFAGLPEGTVEALLADPAALANILTFHVVKGRVFAGDLADGLEVETVQGAKLMFSITEAGAQVNGTDIVATDIEASNGVIHVINGVLLPPPPPDPVNIVETAVAAKDFNLLVAAVEAAGLVDALANGGPFTVFAPVDAAFWSLPDGALEALLADPEALAEILTLHVVEGTFLAADLTDGGELTSLLGLPLRFDLRGHLPRVNGAEILATDVIASNGVIHAIDRVLLPPPNIVGTLEKLRLNVLATAVEAAGLTEVLAEGGPFTVFAPTNRAFRKLPAGVLDALLADPAALGDILQYHVVEGIVPSSDLANGMEVTTLTGETIFVTVAPHDIKLNGVEVLSADKRALNGIVHVVEEVLIAPSNIVETAVANERLSTLVAAVEAAGLVDALANGGPFTVFAPKNSAFAWLPEGVLDALLADPTALANVLTYHVVEGKITSYDLADGIDVQTLQGETIRISIRDHEIKVNDAEVVKTDVFASNGIIHIIDGVLLPPNE